MKLHPTIFLSNILLTVQANNPIKGNGEFSWLFYCVVVVTDL